MAVRFRRLSSCIISDYTSTSRTSSGSTVISSVVMSLASSAMNKILVVGGGLTSAATCSMLTECLSGKDVSIIVWDKARGAGGRMATHRMKANRDCHLDLGAQYISATPDYGLKHKIYYDDLLAKGILQPMTAKIVGMKETHEGTSHFVTPNGVSSVVKHFFQQSQAQLNFLHHLSHLNVVKNQWVAKTKDGHVDQFDCVILTLPVPQLLQLEGQVQSILSAQLDTTAKLKEVEYSSRYALGLFYNKSVDLGLDYDAKYIDNHDILRFVSVDSAKRGKAKSSPTSVVFHTSIPFGKEHVEKTPDQVEPLLVQAVKEAFPNWPQPDEVKCQKWRYSQVTNPFQGQPGGIILSKNPLLIATGDGFSHSNFDGCISAATATASMVKETLAD